MNGNAAGFPNTKCTAAPIPSTIGVFLLDGWEEKRGQALQYHDTHCMDGQLYKLPTLKINKWSKSDIGWCGHVGTQPRLPSAWIKGSGYLPPNGATNVSIQKIRN